MGYCYDRDGRLSCDSCGASGGVRKATCPFGYCPPPALCPACKTREKVKLSRKAHREMGCEKRHLEFAAKEKENQDILDSGRALRRSATSQDDGRVLVNFELKDGRVSYFMSPETYDAIPFGDPATPEDYARRGSIEVSPEAGPLSKQVHVVRKVMLPDWP